MTMLVETSTFIGSRGDSTSRVPRSAFPSSSASLDLFRRSPPPTRHRVVLRALRPVEDRAAIERVRNAFTPRELLTLLSRFHLSVENVLFFGVAHVLEA